MKFLFRLVTVSVGLLVGMETVSVAQTETTQESVVACPYPYAFFDPSKPQITKPKPVGVASPFVFGYPGYYGGWFSYSGGHGFPGGYICGSTWSGYSYCQPVFAYTSCYRNGLTIKVKF